VSDNFELAMILSLQAEMEAVRATIAGMEAENAHRTTCGMSIAYGEEAFEAQAVHLRALSLQFHERAQSAGR
jgi:hypothetical protein